MAVTTVIYAVDAAATISDICDELALLIIANKSSLYKIGVVAYGGDGIVQWLVEPQKLTVKFVSEVRNAASEFPELNPIDSKFTNQEEFAEFCQLHSGISALAANYTVVCRYAPVFTYTCGSQVPLKGLKSESIPHREVKPVKTFDGFLTIGSPQDPFIKEPICMYPATRHATQTELITVSGNDRVVRSSELKTESGATVNMENIEKGYTYLNELVPVNEQVQELMDGEFEGAVEWPQAFEILATIPEVPPWLPNERTDYLVGKTPQAIQFLREFAGALIDAQMHAVVRMCTEPRFRTTKDGQKVKRKKGKVSLVLMHPASEDHIFITQLPLKEDFKSHYRFAEIPNETPKEPELQDLDETMDKLVDGMTVDTCPELIPNYAIERVSQYLKTKIATGKSVVPPQPQILPTITSVELEGYAEKLMSGFGVAELNTFNPDNADAASNEGADFEFI